MPVHPLFQKDYPAEPQFPTSFGRHSTTNIQNYFNVKLPFKYTFSNRSSPFKALTRLWLRSFIYLSIIL
jgi:hypothetical protein